MTTKTKDYRLCKDQNGVLWIVNWEFKEYHRSHTSIESVTYNHRRREATTWMTKQTYRVFIDGSAKLLK